MSWIDDVVRDVAELDYNSPEGQPDVMLVKAKELRAILEARAPQPEIRLLDTGAPRGERNYHYVTFNGIEVYGAWQQHAAAAYRDALLQRVRLKTPNVLSGAVLLHNTESRR